MSAFTLKLIALICMIFDHSRAYFDFLPFWFRCIGRVSFVIFAYFIAEGCRHTRDMKAYLKRLLILALICEIPYICFKIRGVFDKNLLRNIFANTNTIATLFLGALSIYIYREYVENSKNKSLTGFWLLIPVALADIFNVDYGIWGVVFIFVIYQAKDRVSQCAVMAIMIGVKYYKSLFGLIPVYIFNVDTSYNGYVYHERFLYFVCSLVPIYLISKYNDKRGINFKWFFYIFYPLHFIVIYLIGEVYKGG